MNKERILKHLRKAEEEINNALDEALNNNTVITNIDLEYMGQQINDIISELENIDELENEPNDDIDDMSWMIDDEEDYDDNY